MAVKQCTAGPASPQEISQAKPRLEPLRVSGSASAPNQSESSKTGPQAVPKAKDPTSLRHFPKHGRSLTCLDAHCQRVVRTSAVREHRTLPGVNEKMTAQSPREASSLQRTACRACAFVAAALLVGTGLALLLIAGFVLLRSAF